MKDISKEIHELVYGIKDQIDRLYVRNLRVPVYGNDSYHFISVGATYSYSPVLETVSQRVYSLLEV